MIHEDEKEYTHPSYGMIGLSRCSGKAKLFGSSVDHQHYILLTICRAKMVRSHNNDHFYAGKEVFQVNMSPLQLSELLTGMNMGHGVPCTLARMPIGGKYEMVDPPDDVGTTSETYIGEFKDRLAKLVREAEALAVKADEVAEKATANKTERREIAHRISHVIQEIKSNLPFVLEQYVEQIEKVTCQAKAEIESFQQLARLSAGAQSQKKLATQVHDHLASCPKCAGTGELPSGEGCGCEA